MKRLLKALLASQDYEIHKISRILPGSDRRGIGDLTSVLQDLKARGFTILTAMDCGANAGRWTDEFLTVYQDAQVLMIEPQEKMRPYLKAVAERHANARLWIGAVGGRNEKRLFSLWTDTTGSTFLDQPDPAALAEGRQVQLDTKTIPAILEETGFPFPQLIKMDIQGFELEVLRGMEGVLPRVEALILECSTFPFLRDQPVVENIITWLGKRGFSVHDICGFGRRPRDGALSHLDILFARDDGYLRQSKGW